MMTVSRVGVALAFVGCCLAADSVTGLFRGVRYLDEVGHLGTDADPRTSVDFTIAKAAMASDGDIEFSGKDDGGQKWSARLPVIGGVGWTTVWKADFDHNGRPDLMVASHFPGNGRCIENVTVSCLMIDAHGRPNPWVIHTNVPRDTALPPMPAILTDLYRGHAQLIVTDCEYRPRPRLGEDHSITGVYEAHDSVWKLARPTRMAVQATVTSLVIHSSAFRRGIDKLNPVDTAHWANLGNDRPQNVPASGQITHVLPADAGCRGVRLGPVIDRKMTLPDEDDRCKERGADRIRLSRRDDLLRLADGCSGPARQTRDHSGGIEEDPLGSSGDSGAALSGIDCRRVLAGALQSSPPER